MSTKEPDPHLFVNEVLLHYDLAASDSADFIKRVEDVVRQFPEFRLHKIAERIDGVPARFLPTLEVASGNRWATYDCPDDFKRLGEIMQEADNDRMQYAAKVKQQLEDERREEAAWWSKVAAIRRELHDTDGRVARVIAEILDAYGDSSCQGPFVWDGINCEDFIDWLQNVKAGDEAGESGHDWLKRHEYNGGDIQNSLHLGEPGEEEL